MRRAELADARRLSSHVTAVRGKIEIYTKLNVDSRASAVAVALTYGLLSS